MAKIKETITIRTSFRGDRELWVRFVNKVRENRKKTGKTVWKTLEVFIKDYLSE